LVKKIIKEEKRRKQRNNNDEININVKYNIYSLNFIIFGTTVRASTSLQDFELEILLVIQMITFLASTERKFWHHISEILVSDPPGWPK
jgi:hypothetical protein